MFADIVFVVLTALGFGIVGVIVFDFVRELLRDRVASKNFDRAMVKLNKGEDKEVLVEGIQISDKFSLSYFASINGYMRISTEEYSVRYRYFTFPNEWKSFYRLKFVKRS